MTAETTETAETRPAPRVIDIEPATGLRLPLVRELVESRELLYLLAWRDIRVRYKQTVLGALWVVIQPVVTVVVFTLVFNRVGKVPSDGVPYPVFSLAGLVVWSFFSTGLVQAGNSLVNNVPLLTKVYFPRLFIPAATLLAGGVDLAISLVLLVVTMVAYGVTPGVRLLAAPLFLAMAVATTLGAAAGLGALNVRYRDVRYVLPFLVQLLLLATPIAYPASVVGEPWRTLLAINPMAGAVEGFRWSVLGTGGNPTAMVAVSTVSALVTLFAGIAYFSKAERSFADVA